MDSLSGHNRIRKVILLYLSNSIREKKFDTYMELNFFLEKGVHRKGEVVMKDILKSRLKQNILEEAVCAG